MKESDAKRVSEFRKTHAEYNQFSDSEILERLNAKDASSPGRPRTSSPIGEVILPQQWDESGIAVSLQNLSDQPGILRSFVAGILNRFVARQASYTARARLAFLNAKLEELKVASEIQTLIDNYGLRQIRLEIESLKLEIERDDLQQRFEHQSELRKLEHEQAVLRIRLGTEELRRQQHEAANPKAAEPPIDPNAESLKKNRAKQDDLKSLKAWIMADETMSPELREMQINGIDDALASLLREEITLV